MNIKCVQNALAVTRFFNWQLESVIIHACFVVGWELRSNYDEFSEFCRFYIRIGLGNGIWLRHCIIICIYPYVDVPFRENPNGTLHQLLPRHYPLGRKIRFPRFSCNFHRWKLFFTNLANRYRCARCTFWTCCMDYLGLVKAFLRFSWDSFIAESKIDTEFVLQFPSLWCHFIGIWSKEKTKLGSINGCQMNFAIFH